MFISSYPYTFLKSPVSGHLVKSPSPTTALQLNVSCTFTRLSIVLSFFVIRYMLSRINIVDSKLPFMSSETVTGANKYVAESFLVPKPLHTLFESTGLEASLYPFTAYFLLGLGKKIVSPL